MHLITIMDYNDHNSLVMCKSWIYLAKRYNPKATITIFYRQPISEIRQFSSRYRDISFIKLHFPRDLNQFIHGHTHHPVQELQFALWKQLEKLRITKFIYVDADAFILSSLNDWWRIINDQPFIAVSETRRPQGELRLNAGVHSYSDEAGFVTYDKLVEQYHIDGNRILVEAGTQGLIDAYFRRINYTYTHPAIGHEYNAFAKYCQVKRADNSEIVVYSGQYPLTKKVTRMLLLKEKEFAEKWLWWDKPVRVKILHSFGGPGFKFWELPECKTLWNYCVTKI